MSLLGFLERRAVDAVLPGSGVTLGLLDRLKPLLPYIAAAVGALVLALLIWRAPWAEHRQAAKDAATIQRDDASMALAKTRVEHATAVLADADRVMKLQGASIVAHARAEQRALATATALIAAADKRDVGRQAQIASLKAAAARPIAGPPCKSLPETAGDWR